MDEPITWPIFADTDGSDTLGPKFILALILSVTFICRLSFILTQFDDDQVKSNIFSALLALVFSASLICICYNIIRQRNEQPKVISHEEKFPRIQKMLSIFSSSSSSNKELKHSQEQQKSTYQNRPQEAKKPRVDPKYFKPKYIFNELISIWGTTYTVVAWGSFWVIGGTMVATEKLAQKIKTKYQSNQNFNSESRDQTHSFEGGSFNGSGWPMDGEPNEQSNNPSGVWCSFYQTRSCARRSFAVVKRRWSRLFRSTNMPQLTQVANNENQRASGLRNRIRCIREAS